MRTRILAAVVAISGLASAAEPEVKSDPQAKSVVEPANPKAEAGAVTRAQLEELAKAFNDSFGKAEPVRCYRLAGFNDSGMMVGLAVELCAGSIDAAKTIQCFEEAFRSSDDGGLGLSRGLAVDLCRAIPRERS